MARYIDADALIEHLLKLKVVTSDMYGMGIARGIERAETAIQMQPTADVVPKSEVALDVIRKVKNKVRKYKHNVVNPYEHIILYLNELEKKYTEGK